MKKNIIYLALAISALLAGQSCTDSFFEEYPSNKVTEGNFYQSKEDFDQGVRACYASLTGQLAWDINELSYRSDEAKLEDMTAGTVDRFAIDHFQEMASTGMLEDIWVSWYQGINRCNDVLDHIQGKTFDSANVLEAEARFLRAWFYFKLYRVFGTVPLIKKVSSPAVALKTPRCKQEEMKEFLAEDLLFAAENLPALRPAEVGRVTKMAAKALYAKVLLTFGDYAEAEKVLSGIQTDSFYGLMPTTADVFLQANKMNKEMIFVVYYNNATDSGHGAWWTASNLADIKNPTPTFLSIYDSAKDNRYPLISEYHKVASNNYLMNKWYTTFDAVYTTSTTADFPHIRFADVVLMMAEALGQQGKVEDALPYLNKIRKRAGLDNLSIGDVSTKDAFIRALADERGREFALEGQRWYDLVRLGLAVEYFSSLGNTVDNHNLLFPIPSTELEIIADKNILWQNPGF